MPEVIINPHGVNWSTSEACARILHHLECQGEADKITLAKKCHVSVEYTGDLARTMMRCGVIRVVGYLHHDRGASSPIYALGPGENVPRPAAELDVIRMRNRRQSLVTRFGRELANKILKNTRIRVHVIVDGKRLRPGDHDAHIAGKVTR